MSKLPKFLLCENPIADKSDGRIFILHTREPRLLAEIFTFDADDEDAQMEHKKLFTSGSALEYGDEYFVFGVIWMEKNNLPAEKLAGIMRRMADWYEAYLKWEDKNIAKELARGLN